MVPPLALGHLHMEPEEPVARLADEGMVGVRRGARRTPRPAWRSKAQLALVAAALAPYAVA